MTSRSGGGVQIVAIHGEADLATAPELSTMLAGQIRWSEPVVFDLSSVTFMDLAGARSVLRQIEASPRRAVLVLPPGSPARRVLDRGRLWDGVEHGSTLDEALRLVRDGSS